MTKNGKFLKGEKRKNEEGGSERVGESAEKERPSQGKLILHMITDKIITMGEGKKCASIRGGLGVLSRGGGESAGATSLFL